MKSLLLLPAIFLVTFNIFAQQIKSKWSIEGVGGLSAATFYNSNAPLKNFTSGYFYDPQGVYSPPSSEQSPSYYNYSNKLVHRIRYGVSYGFLLSYARSDKWSFVSGVKIENKGLEHEEDHTSWDGIYFGSQAFTFNHNSLYVKFNNRYLTVPFSLRHKLHRNLYVELGIYFSKLLSSEQQLTIIKETVQTNGNNVAMSGSKYNYDNIKPSTSNYDFGAIAGIMYKKPFNDKLSWLVSCQFSLGFRKLDSKYDNDYQEGPSYINSGYYFYGNYNGYSSDSKNMNATLNAGISYNL